MSPDLTIVYITANHINEHFARNIRRQLLLAKGDYPLISVSHKPIEFGKNLVVGEIERCKLNIYKQLLIGAKAAKTKYIAIAEDDVLYSPGHFSQHRPKDDRVAYNMNRWSMYTWKDPVFALKQRRTNTNLIAPRQLFVRALEERFDKYPNPDKQTMDRWAETGRYENRLGVTVQKTENFTSYQPIIVFSHPEALGYLNLGERKRLNPIRAFQLPYWGTAQAISKMYESTKR